MKRLGIKITDAKNRSVIHVSREDCKNAVCRDHQKCVIAKAIMRQKKAKWVDVGAQIVLVGKVNVGKRYSLDKDAREQVQYFDNKGAFAPCKVILRPPVTKVYSRNGDKARSGPSGVRRRQPTR